MVAPKAPAPAAPPAAPPTAPPAAPPSAVKSEPTAPKEAAAGEHPAAPETPAAPVAPEPPTAPVAPETPTAPVAPGAGKESADAAPVVVNSSTHRQEYMVLTRKMASLDAAAFPQATQLWNAGRKDGCEYLVAGVYNQ